MNENKTIKQPAQPSADETSAHLAGWDLPCPKCRGHSIERQHCPECGGSGAVCRVCGGRIERSHSFGTCSNVCAMDA